MRAAVVTHRRAQATEAAVKTLIEVAASVGATLRFDAEEAKKHNLSPSAALEIAPLGSNAVDLCFAVGGDGTILRALRGFVRTGVPVFGVNFGEIGFLSTVDRDRAREGFVRGLAGEFDTMSLPGIALRAPQGEWTAMNDVSVQRQAGGRVANLAYSVGADEIGRVRCDGLVVATPAGSTGYNLANGGPVMAWGVEGMCVSFIAPHSLTARSLVVAPGDVMTIRNQSIEESVDMEVDGRPVTTLDPGEHLSARFVDHQGLLAQIEGANFYQRLGEKFGRLASHP